MKVSEFIEWLKTQDQSAQVRVTSEDEPLQRIEFDYGVHAEALETRHSGERWLVLGENPEWRSIRNAL